MPVRRNHFFAIAVALSALSACAETLYIWCNPAGGNFEDAANWKYIESTDFQNCDPLKRGVVDQLQPADRCPGESDVVGFGEGSCTIVLNRDATVSEVFHFTDGKYNNADRDRTVVMNLNSHTLSLSYLNVVCSGGTAGEFELVVSNGTLHCDASTGDKDPRVGINLKGWGQRSGRLSFYGVHLDVTRQLSCNVNGSAPPTSWLRIGKGCTTSAALTEAYGSNGANATYFVSGEGTRVDAPVTGYSIAAMTISDGAYVDAQNKPITCAATDNRLNAVYTVDHATVTNVQQMTCGYRYSSDYQTLLITNGASVHVNGYLYVGAGNNNTLSGNNRAVVTDGSFLSCSQVELGRYQETNNCLIVDNSEVKSAAVLIGSYSPLKIDGTEYNGTASNNWFLVRGAAPRVTLSGQNALKLNFGGRLVFEIPANGWAQAPISCTHTYSRVTQEMPTIPDCACSPNRLEISADEFARRHPKTRVQLLQLTGQDAAGLSAFADLYVYTGNPKYAGTVTAGERELWYTSPAAAGLAIFVR